MRPWEMAVKTVVLVHVVLLVIRVQLVLATGFGCRDDPAYLSPASGLSCAAHDRWLSSPSSNEGDKGSANSKDCVSKWLEGTRKRNVHELCDATTNPSSIAECLTAYLYTEGQILEVQKHCPKACRSPLCEESKTSAPSAAPVFSARNYDINNIDHQMEAPDLMPPDDPMMPSQVSSSKPYLNTKVNSSALFFVETSEKRLGSQLSEDGAIRRTLIIIGCAIASISALGIIGCTVVSLWRRIKLKANQARRKQRRGRGRGRRQRDHGRRKNRSRNRRSRRERHTSSRIKRKRHRDSIDEDIYHENENDHNIGSLKINVDHHEVDRKKPLDNTINCAFTIRLPAWCDEDLDDEVPWIHDVEQGAKHDDEFQENNEKTTMARRTKEDGSTRTKEDGSTMFSWFGDATNSIIQSKRGTSTGTPEELVLQIPDDLSFTPDRPAVPASAGRKTKRKRNKY